MSSRARTVFLPSSSTPLETTEEYADEEEEYIPLLTARQHFVNNPESDVEEDEEEDTRNVRRGRRGIARTVQLPPPPNFEHFIHSRLLHRAFINLPPNHDANFSKPVNLF